MNSKFTVYSKNIKLIQVMADCIIIQIRSVKQIYSLYCLFDWNNKTQYIWCMYAVIAFMWAHYKDDPTDDAFTDPTYRKLLTNICQHVNNMRSWPELLNVITVQKAPGVMTTSEPHHQWLSLQTTTIEITALSPYSAYKLTYTLPLYMCIYFTIQTLYFYFLCTSTKQIITFPNIHNSSINQSVIA